MRPIAALVCFTGLVWLSGCNTTLKAPPDDPEVSAKCTPVRSLLSKNFRIEAYVPTPLFKAGGLYDRTGAVLDASEATRVALVDAACRAWVNKVISGPEYARVVLGKMSATIVETTTPEERQAVVDSVVKYLDDLKRSGSLPSSFDPSKVPEKVAADAQLTQQQLQASLRAEMSGVEGRIDLFGRNEEARQAAILSGLYAVDQRLAKLELSATPSTPASAPNSRLSAKEPPVDTGLSERTLEVYFITGSAELAYADKQRISEAAKGWAKAGAIIYVMGFTDPRGSTEYNLKLSLARAKAVAAILALHNVTVGAVSGGGVGSDFENSDKLRSVHLRRKVVENMAAH